MANIYEKKFNSISHKTHTNENHSEIAPTPIRRTKIKDSHKVKCW